MDARTPRTSSELTLTRLTETGSTPCAQENQSGILYCDLNDLDNRIKTIENQQNPRKKRFTDHLRRLYNELQTRKNDPDVNVFVEETIFLLDRLKASESNYDEQVKDPKYSDNQAKLALIQDLFKYQIDVIHDFETKCKQTPLFDWNEQLVTGLVIAAVCVVTALCAALGAAAFGALGFVLGGGVFSPATTLIGLYQGTITGAAIGTAIGASLGSLFLGGAGASLSYHFFFAKPRLLTTEKNAIVKNADALARSEHSLKMASIQSPA